MENFNQKKGEEATEWIRNREENEYDLRTLGKKKHDYDSSFHTEHTKSKENKYLNDNRKTEPKLIGFRRKTYEDLANENSSDKTLFKKYMDLHRSALEDLEYNKKNFKIDIKNGKLSPPNNYYVDINDNVIFYKKIKSGGKLFIIISKIKKSKKSKKVKKVKK